MVRAAYGIGHGAGIVIHGSSRVIVDVGIVKEVMAVAGKVPYWKGLGYADGGEKFSLQEKKRCQE